jgi:hypothetical protein
VKKSALLAGCAVALLLLATASADARSVSPYRGTGSWVDRFDPQIYLDPAPAVAAMAAQGVRTLYIQTGNYKIADADVIHPEGLAIAIEAAHAAGMRVVGWYLPGLVDRSEDFRRIMEAIDFTTPTGQKLDSFALDIESTAIGSIPARNLSLVKLTRRVRAAVDRRYALGAIVPDWRSGTIAPGLWPGFPYAAISPYYDVMLPMAYSSDRGHGSRFVYDYTAANVSLLRQVTHRPVHLIAGISNRLKGGEPRAAMAGARIARAIGASFYDFRTNGPREWAALAAWPTLPRSPRGG